MKILGISCFYHDSAVALVEDGRIIAAAQEERFTRKKHDQGFPREAMRYCLAEGEVTAGGLDAVAFYDKPVLKFHRLMETFLSIAPKGLKAFAKAVPAQLKQKLWIESEIEEALLAQGVEMPEKIFFPEHHESHAASAFFPSPFAEAAVLTLDGVGEWATATIGVGEGNSMRLVRQLDYPHSLGLLYSAFTFFTGFKVNSGEYKLMGLAAYGRGKYTQLILDELLDLKADGSFRLNMDYFGYLDDLVMTNDRFAKLFGGAARVPGMKLTTREMDIAKSIQEVTEEIVLRMARHARELTGKSNLCMAGGVALNSVANGRLLREGTFDGLWVQPAAGDAGGALGAALAVWHGEMAGPRERSDTSGDAMQGAYLGPEFSAGQIQDFLDARGCKYTQLSDDEWAVRLAELIDSGKILGLFQGRMEYGPRALGNRSIVSDPRSKTMQSNLNSKIKFRESFRPFAPAVLEERVSDYFDLDEPSPHMLLVAPVQPARCHDAAGDERELEIHTWVNRARSDIPAVTHVDYSARVQTVSAVSNPRLHELIKAFDARTGCGLLINTSFNVREEPIVCTPADAYRCFMSTGMDVLSLGPFMLLKEDQSDHVEADGWQIQSVVS